MNPKHPRALCLYCNKQVIGIYNVYCDNRCQAVNRWLIRKRQMEASGVIVGGPKCARRYLKELYGERCSICSLTQWFDNTIPVVLDHIDGNSDNWNIDNLRLICPNCDVFTPFYKSKNKGNGRFARRQRYLAGLSY